MPKRDTQATLVDLLDRVLDKGLVIHADLIVSVAGIPLIGVNLRTAVAGMETMLRYGVMQAWDQKIRDWEKTNQKNKTPRLRDGEEIRTRMPGACRQRRGIEEAWRHAHLYLTNQRVILYHEEFGQVLFETPLSEIRGLSAPVTPEGGQASIRQFYLFPEGRPVACLRALRPEWFRDLLAQEMDRTGVAFDPNPPLSTFEERPAAFVRKREQVVCSGKMWHLATGRGILSETWRPGHLYLTDQRLCWWSDHDAALGLAIGLPELACAALGTSGRAGTREARATLEVVHEKDGPERRVASFSGPALEDWSRVLSKTIRARGDDEGGPDGLETCPGCKETTSEKILLSTGCPECGWTRAGRRMPCPPAASMPPRSVMRLPAGRAA